MVLVRRRRAAFQHLTSTRGMPAERRAARRAVIPLSHLLRRYAAKGPMHRRTRSAGNAASRARDISASHWGRANAPTASPVARLSTLNAAHNSSRAPYGGLSNGLASNNFVPFVRSALRSILYSAISVSFPIYPPVVDFFESTRVQTSV